MLAAYLFVLLQKGLPRARKLSSASQQALDISVLQKGSSLDTTGYVVKCKGSRIRICTAPGPIEARIDRSSGSQCSIVGKIRNSYRTAGLRIAPIPELRNSLPIRKAKLQRPAIQRSSASISDDNTGPKAARPLSRNSITYSATRSRCCRRRRCWSHARSRSRCHARSRSHAGSRSRCYTRSWSHAGSRCDARSWSNAGRRSSG